MKHHFLDVGANVGQTFDDFLLPVSDYDGWKVWCFEPSARHLSTLLLKAAEVGKRYDIHVCPFGLGGLTGAHQFFPKDDPEGDSFYRDFTADHEITNLDLGYSLVQMSYSVVDFIRTFTCPEDEIVLKIDAEGSEYGILNELSRSPDELSRIKDILVEFHVVPPLPPGWMGSGELTEYYRNIGHPIRPWSF